MNLMKRNNMKSLKVNQMVFMSVLRGFVNTSTTIKDLDNKIPYSCNNE